MNSGKEIEDELNLPFIFFTMHNGSPLALDPELVRYWSVVVFPAEYETIVQPDGTEVPGEMIHDTRVFTRIAIDGDTFDLQDSFEIVTQKVKAYDDRLQEQERAWRKEAGGE
jgi:hypothetical protein